MILLKEATEKDAKFLFEMKKDPEFKKYFPNFLITKTLEEEKKLVKNYQKGSKKMQEKQFIILSNKKRVGSLEIYKANKKHNRGSIGYSVKKEYWGKGIAKKACKMGLEIMKKEFKIHSVEATTHPKNISSQKVLEKNGFKKIGLMKDYYYFNKKYIDRILYWKILD